MLFWAHLSAGVTAGLVILLMSGTGVLLTYQRQLIAWADRVPAARPPSASATPLAMDELLARLAASPSHPTAPFSVAVRNDPDAPVVVSAGADGVLLVSGSYLWLPRVSSWRTLRPLVWFRWAGTARARHFNWHHVVALWCFVPLLVIIASGVVMSYVRANALYLRFGHTGEVFGFAGQTIAGLASLGAVALGYTGLSLAVRRLRARV